jgi:hypothetical protein
MRTPYKQIFEASIKDYTLYIDMDGVLTDFEKQFKDTFKADAKEVIDSSGITLDVRW